LITKLADSGYYTFFGGGPCTIKIGWRWSPAALAALVWARTQADGSRLYCAINRQRTARQCNQYCNNVRELEPRSIYVQADVGVGG